MLKFLKSFFSSKTSEPAPVAPYKVETPEAKVEAVNAQPVAEEKSAKAPAKKRTFVKREEGDAKAKVAKIKAPAKPKAPRKPKAK